ncbi:MAG: SDR family NAD(P)-dependent oxidoreductase, partial [Endomicrobiales bacterium]|nr:SDR family NAD(P)-dependent oxidoreductase [Endomicrobiales bacterium]
MPTKKTVLITGGSGYIGSNLAAIFAKNNYNIVFSYHNNFPPAAQSIATSLKDIGTQCMAIKADLSKHDDAKNLVEETLKIFSKIDVLINNAATSANKLIHSMSEQEWDTVINTDLSGCFWVLKYSAFEMVKQNSGSIINISSIIALNGAKGCANYAAAKAGLIALTKTAARELGENNITVNAVLPGFHLKGLGKDAT